ncbi:hypothetical protein JCM11641_000420 [Rhodosporidiobolus odoratus]
MSLYGGISFSAKSKQPQDSPATPAQPTATPASSSVASSRPQSQAEANPNPSNWSAALRFAPTVRKKPAPSAVSRPGAIALKSVFGASADADDDEGAVTAQAARFVTKGKASLVAQPDKKAPINKWSAVSKPEAAELVKPFAPSTNTSSAPASASPAPTTATRTRARRIIVPPSFVLEDIVQDAPKDAGDVNGFQNSAAGMKLAQQEKKREKKKKGKGKARDDPALAFTSVPYDPARPCDYAAYKTHVRLLRAQRRLEREEEDRRRRDREGSADSGSSYYSQDERDKEKAREDEERASKKPRFFAPPTSYDDPPGPSSAGPSFPPPSSYEPPSAPSREETGDEAYARRLALSSGAPPSFQRTAAAPASQPAAPAFPPAAPAFQPASALPPAVSAKREETGEEAYARCAGLASRTEETGEEAYQRRLALSRGAPPPPPPTFAPASRAVPPPPPPFVPPSFAPATAAGAYPAPPPPPPGFMPPPGASFPAQPQPYTQGPPSFSPASSASFTTVNEPSSASAPSPSAAVDAAQAKAREIAARLSKLGGAFAPPSAPATSMPEGAGPAPPGGAYPGFAPAGTLGLGTAPAEAAEPDTRSFSERLMSKYGWEAGKGLGASESGITSALSAHKAPTGPSKKALAKAKKAGEAPPPPAPTGMSGRNTVVDKSRDQRLKEEKERMGGEASRVVLLTNLCAREEVDDDLPGEVAEEAGKFGVVERCAVKIVPGAPEEEGVRIFLVMSGLAGGYNAVRNFDGRFFGGRTVKARFYNEKAFHAGQHDL